MKDYVRFYEEKLYPLQDGILKVVNDCGRSLYLTGGTALSRFYLNHRYSDDLDFFSNASPGFLTDVTAVLRKVQAFCRARGFRLEMPALAEGDFVQARIYDTENTCLKLDFVNDIEYRVGDPGRVSGCMVDSLENILTNKVGALYRFAAKDLADLVAISRHARFFWPAVFKHVERKVLGISAESIAQLLQTVPDKVVTEVRWTAYGGADRLMIDISRMSKDILMGSVNQLAPDVGGHMLVL
ncbi:MAG: nucleotidyl transferase AbiEii/AbiGii toxin family protein [Spirochaetales bacterium]|nr:nucleotidyl transferase AbiEii/AbiGii toxin family protein [Spirochaetales bacterium]